MSRYAIHLGSHPALNYFYAAYGLIVVFPDWLTDYRDRIRSVLDPMSTGLQWSVSDLMIYSGLAGAEVALIQIIHKDGAGNPTGHVWTQFWHYTNSNTWPSAVLAAGDTPTIQDHFCEIDGTAANLASTHFPLYHYSDRHTRIARFTGVETGAPTVSSGWSGSNSHLGVFSAGTVQTYHAVGDWSVRLDAGPRVRIGDVITDTTSGNTLTVGAVVEDNCLDMGFANYNLGTAPSGAGNDFTDTVATNPYTSIASCNDFFAYPMTSHHKGILLHADGVVGGPFNFSRHYFMIVDDTFPFVAMYVAYDDMPVPNYALVQGDYLISSFGGDTYLSGSVGTAHNVWASGIPNKIQRGGFVGRNRTTGNRDSFLLYFPMITSGIPIAGPPYTSSLTPLSEVDVSGRFVPHEVLLANGTDVKGSVNPNICAQISAHRWGIGRVFNGSGDNALIRVNEALAFPWKKGEMSWPCAFRWNDIQDRSTWGG